MKRNAEISLLRSKAEAFAVLEKYILRQNAAAIWPGNDLAATADEANPKKCDEHVAESATMIATKLGLMITGR